MWIQFGSCNKLQWNKVRWDDVGINRRSGCNISGSGLEEWMTHFIKLGRPGRLVLLWSPPLSLAFIKHLLGMGHSGGCLKKSRICTIAQMVSLFKNDDNRYNLLNTFRAACMVLNLFHGSFLIILLTPLEGGFYVHFSDGKCEEKGITVYNAAGK